MKITKQLLKEIIEAEVRDLLENNPPIKTKKPELDNVVNSLDSQAKAGTLTPEMQKKIQSALLSIQKSFNAGSQLDLGVNYLDLSTPRQGLGIALSKAIIAATVVLDQIKNLEESNK